MKIIWRDQDRLGRKNHNKTKVLIRIDSFNTSAIDIDRRKMIKVGLMSEREKKFLILSCKDFVESQEEIVESWELLRSSQMVIGWDVREEYHLHKINEEI